MTPNIIDHIAATAIPPVAWKRAKLEGEPRATLGDCTLSELYRFCGMVTTTPEGLAFTKAAGTMVAILEEQHDAEDAA